MMQNTELLPIADGGIQTVIPELATMSPQIIYLDFDGELTSYHNHDLDIHIDDVAVEDSGLTQERIASIVKALNDDFTSQNVIFVTERPTDTEFSTIYVGKTSDFDEYGNFTGLAETVDIDNQIKNDNAFVMLDNTVDDSAIIETITHEVRHLIGTLEHGGEGIGRYAEGGYIYYYYLNNQTFTGELNGSYLYLSKSSTGRTTAYSSYRSNDGNVSSCIGTRYVSAKNAIVNSDSWIDVRSGGTASATTVNSSGWMVVSSGGGASATTVNSIGRMYVEGGGKVEVTTVNPGGKMYVYIGGTANSLIIHSAGSVSVSSGGILEGEILLGGKLTTGGAVIATDAEIVFDLTQRLPEDMNAIMVDNLANLEGASLSISVISDQQSGIYKLAGYGADFHKNVTLIVNENETGIFVWDDNRYNDINIDGQMYSLNLNAYNELCFGISTEEEEIPDQVLEMLARNTGEASSVYLDQTPATIHILNYENKEYRFLVSLFVDDTITDFQAMCLIRVDNNNTPLGQSIVVCRGSEIKNWDFVTNLKDWDSDFNGLLAMTFLDWQDDFNSSGVGYGQYVLNKAGIMEWLEARKDDTIYFTGHSLGGALAQRFASDYQGKIGGCVTFNSPGINDSKEIHATKVHHYVVNGDLISMIGNGYVYGDNASDSWYAMYMGNNRYDGPVLGSNDEENPTSYLLNRHTATSTSNENNGVDWGTISILSDSEFSYIGAHDNFNANYARFVLSLAQRYERAVLNNILCSDYYIKNPWFFQNDYKFDISVANKLTTRKKAEEFRKEDRQCLFFLKAIVYDLFDNEPDFMSDITLGDKKLQSANEILAGHEIYTLEFSKDSDNLPDLLYDFTHHEFIEIHYVKLEDDIIFSSNDHENNVNYVKQVRVEKQAGQWNGFVLPSSSNNFMELISIMTDSGKEIPISNYFILKDKIIVLDDSDSESIYNFICERNETITVTEANTVFYQDNVTISTAKLNLEVSDIDSSKKSGGENDEIIVMISNGSNGTSTSVTLSETSIEGIFTGSLEIGGENGFSVIPGEELVLSYLDNNIGNGEQQTITTSIPVLQMDIVLTIDETGLDADYTAISKDVAWYKFNVMVDSNTLAGTYVIAENMGDYQVNCVIWGSDSLTSEALTDDVTIRIDANTYSKQIIDDKLMLTVKTAPRSIRWEEIEGTTGYVFELSQDNFESVVQLLYWGQEHTQVDLLNMPNGEYSYRVRTFENYADLVFSGLNAVFDDDDWMLTDTITVKNNVVSEQRVSDGDDHGDFFFGNVRGVWDENFRARHFGVGEWEGTGEKVALTGKNKITDVFQGSNDESVLLLTDDENGDALFIDDIYSEFPEGLDAQARIAMISEIAGGAGDDIIDLTSQRFEYVGGGMSVYGGLGDDIIWANKICYDHIIWANQRYNWLFGDAGDDRIVGAGSNDVIAGGIGNDSMHGGGGSDIFTFGGNWGNDIVEQLPDGKVTLWFQDGDLSKWDANTLTYTDGSNSVKVMGVGLDNISLNFSYGDMHPELAFDDQGNVYYGYLAGIGAFDDYVSEKIFDDRNRGMLA